MGEILSAVNTARAAVDTFGGGGGGMDYTMAGMEGLQPADTLLAPPQTAPPEMAQPMTQPMGDTGQSYMSALIGDPMASGLTNDQPAPPPEPFDNPYTKTDQPIEEDIVVEGDDWKPKKLDFLGQLGDALLMARGRRPIFSERLRDRNMKDALQGAQKDPERAIARVRQVDPDTAWEMQEDLSRMKANEELAAGRALERKLKGGEMMGSMIASLPDDDAQAEAIYSKTYPTLQRMAEYFGYDKDLLPSKFDRGTIEAIKSQGMSAYEQARLRQFATTETREAAHQRRSLEALIQHREATRAEIARHNEATEALGEKTYSRIERNEAMKRAEEEGVMLGSQFKQYQGLQPGQYVFSPDKKNVIMKRDDGYIYGYRVIETNGQKQIDTGKPVFRGTTLEGYLSK